jgi:hypothetical protein
MDADEYHADNSLSSSGARKLLPPSCPAQFKYAREHPQAPKKEFDYGHAAHKLVLGDGPELALIDYSTYLGGKAKAERDEARAAGLVPLLRHEYEQVEAMAAAIRQHPVAGPLFKPGSGIAERSIFWTDETTGVRRRCRPDWLKELPGLTICADYKTTTDANPEAVSKAIRDHGYHQQDPWYLDGLAAAGTPNARFIFAFQSKKPPYLVTVRELDELTRSIGRAKNDAALRLYAECTASGQWPDWTGPIDDIPVISLPTWAAIKEAEEYLQ